jgi:DEAD/DEAH box helicase domain-containing protein
VPAIFIYDRYPGGLGYAERGGNQIETLLAICCDMVLHCSCMDGCPSCVGLPNLRPAIHSDPDLTRGFPIPDKGAACWMLRALTARDSSSAGEIDFRVIGRAKT